MQIYVHEFECKDMVSPIGETWDFYPYNEYELEEICFFDIETTGLSAATSNIYLIGAGYYEKEKGIFKVVQWFADDYNSEKDMLKEFLGFLKKYKVLFQYNGNTFDIPYVRTKCKRHRIDCSILQELKHVDLYVSLRKYAGMLGLENKKLKSFEKYIGLDREDEFDGGALIDVYVEYVHNKILRKENEPLLHLLLLHNYEDITGLSQVAALLYLKELGNMKVNYEYSELSEDDSMLDICYKGLFPSECEFVADGNIECVCTNKDVRISVPIKTDLLKYYFSDYKDYYYMIEEDTVMHKSVAVYADSSVRRKAKKAECFVKKEGNYLPVKKQGCFSDKYHIFKKEYTSKEYYIDIDEINQFGEDEKVIFYEKYFLQLFN